MALDPIVLNLSGDPTAMIGIAEQQLAGLGYSVARNADGWSGEAEVGSAVGRALGGGFVRRMKLTYFVAQGPAQGYWVLTITPAMSGAGGGVLGVSKAKKEMASVYGAVTGGLAQAGIAP